jgi:hypothetical protein
VFSPPQFRAPSQPSRLAWIRVMKLRVLAFEALCSTATD